MKTETVPSFQETPAGSSCHLSNLLSRRKVMAVGVFVWLLCLLSALLVVLGGWLGSSVSGVASSPLLLEGFIPLATCPLCPEILYYPCTSYIQAKEATTGKNGPVEPSHLWEAYCQATAPHPAVHSPNAEATYTCGIVNLLLQGLWLNSSYAILTGSTLSSWVSFPRPEIQHPAHPVPLNSPQYTPSPVAAPGEPEIPARPSSEVEGGQEAVEGDLGGMSEKRKVGNNSSHFLQPNIRGPLFLCGDSELESPLSETPGHFLTDRIQDALCALEGSQALEPKGGEGSEGAEAEEGPGTETETVLPVSTLNFCPEIQIDIADKELEQGEVTTSVTALLEGPEKTCSSRPSCLEKDLTNDVTYLDPSLPPVLLSSSPPGPLSSATFSFEPLSSPDGPVVIQNLHITEHSGTRLHPCTRCTVKYETSLDGENSSLQQLAYHTVNHRYWEFLNLQFIKNVKGPKNLFPDLPFGNMDSDRVEQLCAIPEIANNSEEVQEFLAVNTDARISFVKKPFMVSRIEKMVVSAIVDTLKTAFPCSESQGPTEELSEAETESRSHTEGKKASKSRLRFLPSKISPALSVTEAQDKILYCLQEGNVESKTLSMSGMESFIEKQTKLLEMEATEAPEKDPEQLPKGHVDSCLSDAAVNDGSGTETELADTALNLLLLLLTEQWKWLCTENMWLEVQVANLTSPQCWVQYLWLLQESTWPGGVLPKFPQPVRTQEQKLAAEKQALQSLMGVLPDLIVEILGVNKCQLSSLQQPLINRHLIYCLGDIILDLSASVEESAATTSASDTPGSPKRMGVSS
uniref:Sorting nexin C-terminal domain-containing protein n=1 Tax=Pan troglodytes TaxID=9598 RepID=A0A2I3TJW4_PANTR